MKKLFQMKNLKLLNKKYLSIILFFVCFASTAQSQEPIDIWKVDEKQNKENEIITDSLEKKDIDKEVELTRVILNAMQSLDCSKLIFFSTAKIYGDNSFSNICFVKSST